MIAPRAGTNVSSATLPWRTSIEGVGRVALAEERLALEEADVAARSRRSARARRRRARRRAARRARTCVKRVASPCSFGRADRGQLLGDVDPDRAPGDAAAAADAARAAELVVPGAELVGQPLPVARAGRSAGCCRRGCRSGRPRSRVPDARCARPASPVRSVDVLDARAEAGRADQGAVAAGEAALGDLVPARMLEVVARAGSRMSVGVERRGPCCAAAPSTAACGGVEVGRAPPGGAAARRAPRRRARCPTSTRKRCSPSRISVSARS